jgi:eukaryotic-like serine/threonine-protein kinase
VSNPDEDEKLLAAAGSISAGQAVDWNELRKAFADSDQAAIVDQLQLLNGIVAAHSGPGTWGTLQITGTLGEGAFATVYRAFDPDLQREIALKVSRVDASLATDPQQPVREARLLARVRHPNVVTVFGAQRKDDAVALAMELINGQTLEDQVNRQGALSASEATLVGQDLCRALAAVHEAGLIHGDIKAHNVMREAGGRIVLMDFGTGKDLENPVATRSDFAGTPLYLAPEVFAGQPRTKASDIYSLGVLLYYLSTATYPVTGTTRTEIDNQHTTSATRRRLRDARPDLPDGFVSVVEKAIAENASERYQTAGAFEAALAGTMTPTPGRTPLGRPVIAGAVLLAASLVGTALYFGSKTAASATGIYRVEAALYRVRDGLPPARLSRGERLAPGDRLFLQLQTSVPAFAYVVNEDAAGHSILLYPLPGQTREPLPAARSNRLPGVQGDGEKFWEVTTPGEREHFVIFVSPQHLPEVEQLVSGLPAPRQGAPVEHPSLSTEQVTTLRSVGGLAPAPDSGSGGPRLSTRYTTPLSDAPEDARGPWIRQIVFDNPRKGEGSSQ